MPGLGYVVLQKKIVFGWLIMLSSILYDVYGFIVPMTEFSNKQIIGVVAGILMNIAFAYDAYQLAKEDL